MTQEAFSRFEQYSQSFVYHNTNGAEIANRCKSLPSLPIISNILGTHNKNSDIILATKGEAVIGATSYIPDIVDELDHSYTYVAYQESLPKYPGAGLGMLKFLLEAMNERQNVAVRLHTYKRPIGLGNLGFKPEMDRFQMEFPCYVKRLD